MAFDMNAMMRRAGNRSRSLPNIGQGTPPPGAGQAPGPAMPGAGNPQANPLSNAPATMVANAATGGRPPAQQMQPPPQPQVQAPGPAQPGMAAPAVQPSTFTLHPPGTPPDPNQYNYEPQPDGAWRVYPPGIPAPPHALQASLPRAASTADYRRMRQAFESMAPRQ
jgi:hypothetical protein